MAERKLVDAKNTFCPGPLMELIGQMKMAEVGDELEILSTDQGSANDIPEWINNCLLYTSPSPRDQRGSRMPSSA